MSALSPEPAEPVVARPPLTREELYTWAENAVRERRSYSAIVAHLVASGMEFEDANELIEHIKASRPAERWLRYREVEKQMASERRSPWLPLAISVASLGVGAGTYAATSSMAAMRGGMVILPTGLILFGAVSLFIGVRRFVWWNARKK